MFDAETNHMITQINYWAGVRDGLGLTAVWSMYDPYDPETTPRTANSDSGVPGGMWLVYRFWDDSTGADAETSTLVEGSTLLDLYKAADQVIRASGDLHHIYVEAVELDAENNVWILTTGS